MAFDVLPEDAVSFDDYEFLMQFPAAIDEKTVAAISGRFARGAWVYDKFTITAVADNGDGTFTLTDSTKATDPNWISTSGWTTSPPRWYGWDATLSGPAWAWPDYDVVLDIPCFSGGRDPRKVIQAQIVAANGATTLIVSDLSEFITSRTCASLASLVGYSGKIIRRGGANWTRGWPDWPNSVVYAQGTVKAADTGTLTSSRALAHLPLTGKDILYRDGADKLQRGRITGVSGTTPTYTGTTAPAVVGGAFYVVAANAYFQWGRVPISMRGYYRGLQEGWYAHHPHDDSIGVATMPQFFSQELSLGTDITSCPIPSTYPIFGKDLWVDQDMICEGARDYPLSPDIHKTIGQWWEDLADIIGNYVDPVRSFTGADTIRTWTEAEWLSFRSINPVAGTSGTHTGTGLPASLSVPYTPIDVAYAVLGSRGELLSSGTGSYDGTEISGSFSSACDAKAIVGSLGPTRIVPRRYSRMFDQWFFKPDVEDSAAVVPPVELNPGVWIFRPKSTHYLAATQNGGFVGDSDLAADAFADGDLARYVGQQFSDPGLNPNFLVSTPMNPLVPYYDATFVGTRSRSIQSRINASMSGKATGGSTRQLIDTAKDWLAVDFYGSSNGLTHEGTGGGSSSTTQLVDSTKAGSTLWAAARFSGFSGPLVGFTVQFLIDGDGWDDPGAIIEKRIIGTGNGVTGTLGWGEPTSVSTDGLSYRIAEPLVLNRWAGRKLKLSKPNPADTNHPLTAEVVAIGNDGDHLFFPAIAWAVDETTTYHIIDPHCGGVWKRDSGAWIVPTGNDPRSPFPKFKRNQNYNLETHVYRYGRPLPMDVTYDFQLGWDELVSAITALKRTKRDAVVSNRLDPDVTEPNSAAEGAENGAGTCVSADNSGFGPASYDTPACQLNPINSQHDYTLLHDEVLVANDRFERRANSVFNAPVEAVGPIEADYSVMRSYAAASEATNSFGEKPGDVEQANIFVRWDYLFTRRNKADCIDGAAVATIRWFCYAQIDAADHDEGSSGDGYDLYNFRPGPEPLQYRKWAEVDSTSSLPDTLYHSRKIGGGSGATLVHPDPPTLPPESDPAPVDADTPGPSIIHYGGFYVSDTCALLDWTGMKYV